MNTLIAIIGLGVLCLLFEILNLRKAIIPMTIIGLLAILGLDISEFNSCRLLQQYDYCQ
jgi:NADH-quinone oxidoreductase subunit N